MPKTIIIADDHPITAKGMETILKGLGFNVIGLYTNGLHAFNNICLHKPDYALLDMQMPGMCGLDIVKNIRAKNLKTKIIIYTMFTDISVFKQAMELNVNGYLLKEFAIDDLKECLNEIEKGNNWYNPKLEEKLNNRKAEFSPELYCKLTTKERSIVNCIANNMSSKEIALEQFITEKTVESHRRNIKNKLELTKKNNALLVWAIENKGFFSLMD
ncbi:DNA-binding response regulator [Lacinutrix jangbogonensis]|uniref:DNA-binding response regulator n=1 Tax=Lacinutrix jangbogonensis TaxID=1469557 RepID=UPI00053EC302|nr:response regulator transcription factor [Lacinutrix jangbogonensis]